MWLQARMFLLVAVLFAILYGALVLIGNAIGIGNAIVYLVLAFVFLGIQYLIGPTLVAWTMRVRWVTPQQEPELHRMVTELAQRANIPKPRVGISEMSIPNAFAFGRSHRDGRVCVTRGILNILGYDELKAVMGHEISHIKHRDMAIITLLSAIPMVFYWLALNLMWGGMLGGRRDRSQYAMLLGVGAFIMYFVTNLLVLYGSRIREYYADLGSVRLGCKPHHMASALYRLVLASARPRSQEELKQVQSIRAFFVNDPAHALKEVREVSQIDLDGSGRISQVELMDLRRREVRLGFADKMMELFTTHPNMLKRIKHLSTLS